MLENENFLRKEIDKRRSKNVSEEIKGLEKIGMGNNRIVYRIKTDFYGKENKGCVLKISLFDSIENKQEVQAWNKYKKTKHKIYITPIIKHSQDYTWLLMPYGDPVPEDIVSNEIIKYLEDLGGTDISKKDFIYLSGNASGMRCCDYASL